MDCYISADGDGIGQLVGRARLTDDVEQVRRIAQSIDAGNEIWRSFALRVGGSCIEAGGDEICIEIDASHLSEVPEIAEQYAKCVGATVTVGVGLKLSESSKALLIGKMRGKDQIVLWHPDMEKDLQDAELNPKSESEKISDEYLEKADRSGATTHTSHDVGKIRGAHAGFSGYHKPGSKAASAEPDAVAVKDTIKAGNALQPPQAEDQATGGSMHNDFEAMLHQAAQGQEQEDGNQEVAGDVDGENVKQKLVQILAQVKQQLPVLSQLQQTAPEAYQSIMNLVQGVIMLGRKMNGPEQQNRPIDGEEPANVQKSEEDLNKAISQIPAGKRVEMDTPGYAPHDYSHVLPEQHQQAGMKLMVDHNHLGGEKMASATLYAPHPTNPGTLKPIGHVEGYINHKKDKTPRSIEPHSDLDKEYRGKGLGTAMYEALFSHAKHKLGINRVEGGSHSADANALHTRLAEKHGLAYRPRPRPVGALAVDKFPYKKYSYSLGKEELSPDLSINEDELIGPGKGLHFMCDCENHDLAKDELEKGGMGSSGGSEAGRVHEDLPVGTVKQNKIKVSHGDGGVSWNHISAGAVQGQDDGGQPFGANSHPVSSRSPNGK